jgi:cytidine deaminase
MSFSNINKFVPSMNVIHGITIGFISGISIYRGFISWKPQQNQISNISQSNEHSTTTSEALVATNLFISYILRKIRIFVESHRTFFNIALLVSIPSLSMNGVEISKHRQVFDRVVVWSLIACQLFLGPSNNEKSQDITNNNANDKILPEVKRNIDNNNQHDNNSVDHVDSNTEPVKDEPPSLIRIIGKDNLIPPGKQIPPASSPPQYLELLIHNVSHSDLILSLDVDTERKSIETIIPEKFEVNKHCLARAKFSCFQKYSKLVLQNAIDATQNDAKSTKSSKLQNDNSIIYLPRFLRSMNEPRYQILQSSTVELPLAPAGIRLCNPLSCKFTNRSLQNDFRIRSKDIDKLGDFIQKQKSIQSTTATTSTQHTDRDDTRSDDNDVDSFNLEIGHVFFPHLATLLPVWEQSIHEKQYGTSSTLKRVLILVTGVGSPRNMSHSVAGNSTKHCGRLIKYFMEKTYPDITVVQVHSDTNLFRYDENLIFVDRDLLPTIDIYRDALATGKPLPDEVQVQAAASNTYRSNNRLNFTNDEWRKQMNVTLSFADGAPARTTAIQASMRHYKPSYFHFWQRKTFWYEEKIVDDDIEIQSFEAMMETSPAKDVDHIQDKHIQLITQEMKAFYNVMIQTLADSSDKHDLFSFWLRKTKKPVLAVLLVLSPDMKEPQLFRGTNMEVSMPTGSLCAERNVIGSALSSNPHLKRQDLKLIAVLAVPQIESDRCIEISTEGAPVGLNRVTSYSSIVDVFPSGFSSRKHSLGSDFDEQITFGDRQAKVVASKLAKLNIQEVGETSSTSTTSMTGEKNLSVDVLTHNRTYSKSGASGSSTPIRKIPLYPSGNTIQPRNTKRAVVIHSNKDINPLKPCGACNEWLKKIAESNPYFRIITFTDANCNGIYVSPCQE